MKISTVIPVYNAKKYIKTAVESVLQFDEVTEIILVEDGSNDNSYQACLELQTSNDKIKVFRHPGGVNKGAGASRNLGINLATGEYISFLDADDFYLPNRFDAEKNVFQNNHKADAVYGALGVHFYSNESEKKFKNIFFENQQQENYLTTMTSVVKPEELFENLLGINKNSGYFHLDCLTIRANRLKEMSYWFNENLKLHQDTEFIIRLSYHLTVCPGLIHTQIAKRGVHQSNRITSVQVHSRKYFLNKYKLFKSLYEWSKNEGLDSGYVLYLKNVKRRYQINVLLPIWQKSRPFFNKALRKIKTVIKK